MRPFSIELVHEVVEAGLLLQAIHARRPGCLLFESEVHALMAAILLGMARFDVLDGNAQAQPPDGEF